MDETEKLFNELVESIVEDLGNSEGQNKDNDKDKYMEYHMLTEPFEELIEKEFKELKILKELNKSVEEFCYKNNLDERELGNVAFVYVKTKDENVKRDIKNNILPNLINNDIELINSFINDILMKNLID